MYDNNVFAVFTAFDQRNMASSAFRLSHNSQWFRKAEGGVAEEPTIDSRETTPAPGPPCDDAQSEEVNENRNDNSGPGAVDRLVVTFDQLREKLHDGIQLGTDPKVSHILLGHRGTKGISGRQCNVVVDDELLRRRDTWILAYGPGPGAANRFGLTTIHAGTLAVEIEFPNHAAAHPEYVKNLQAFADRCAAAAEARAEVPAVEGLGLDSEPATQAATEAPTPGDRLIYYKGKRVGKREFGEVHLVFRARDGLVFAAKTFKPLLNKRKREEELPAWLTKIQRESLL
ncbi:hypothetical protein MKZ38_005724 [Zalerion maritima]|uniref:Uncharacterized protein n=1 Tax=Zalerion maritima TaxID=339359 RepID=A0AAD5RJS3_9PEZI|nr:hypothetical protein MKZ38_005724 [Zalerion maritima]